MGQTGYNCACPTGWSGDGMTCYEDAPPVQTCSQYNPCAAGATCMDTTNGPECMCGKGFKGNGRLFETTDEHKARPIWASTYDTSSGSVSGSASSGTGSTYSGSTGTGPTGTGSTYSGSSG